jgi:hypothetical protein
MKKTILFLCLISSIYSFKLLAQNYDDLYFDKPKDKQNKETDCSRLKVTVDQFNGNRTFTTPITTMRPFKSIYAPQMVLSKVINSSGDEAYFLSFSIPGSAYIEGKEYNNDCIVLFENGKRIEKKTEVTIKTYSGTSSYSRYSTNLLLDSLDVELLRNNKMKAIRLINFDLDKIVVPEFYMFYLNCLIEKK